MEEQMKRRLAIFALALSAAGCAPYTRVQIGLAEQARRGVQMWKDREADGDVVSRAQFARQRAELGRAFDQDARERPAGELSADWVIEARKAYAAGIDAIARADSAALSANETARRNADVTDQALQKLLWLESIELDVGSTWDFVRRERP
jgi:hypothetical protein